MIEDGLAFHVLLDRSLSKQSLRFYVFILPALALSAGCAACRHEVCTPILTASQRGIVFSVDGAGGFKATSEALAHVITEANIPLKVEEFDWSHGYFRVLSDHMDYCNAMEQGRCLGAEILALRRQCPTMEIYVVAHSAGSLIALTAASAVPTGSINRIVLLAPAVSEDYDLRPALSSAREGIDVFYSDRDVGYLGVGVGIFGTADRCWGPSAAGRTGFCINAATPVDLALYRKLRQHPWNPCVAWTGNLGGHYGGYQEGFLRAYVLPLLATP